MKKILVLNGPNLNMTGIRKKNVYGAETLKDINEELKAYGKANGARVSFFQSNHCLLYTSPSPRDATLSRMPSSA